MNESGLWQSTAIQWTLFFSQFICGSIFRNRYIEFEGLEIKAIFLFFFNAYSQISFYYSFPFRLRRWKSGFCAHTKKIPLKYFLCWVLGCVSIAIQYVISSFLLFSLSHSIASVFMNQYA